jgi:stearoyl-CoA desaturase (delta-9 desaturase)
LNPTVALAVATVALVKLVERRVPRGLYQAVLVVGILLPLAATCYAMALLWRDWMGWRELSLFLGLYVATGLGTTLGYHRLAAHRSFETRAWVKCLLLVLGSMNLQGHVVNWVAFHRKHHAHSDRDGDPHTPRDGFIHAHVGWIIKASPADRERYCRDLLRDPVVRVVDRTATVWAVAGLAGPYLLAGWKGALWGGFVRIAFTNHVTYAVNSICHRFGSRPFETRDESRNNWLVGALALGEGWHNNHHAFPSMAYHGMRPRQLDLSGVVLRLLVHLRLAWNVKEPPPALVETRRRPPALA